MSALDVVKSLRRPDGARVRRKGVLASFWAAYPTVGQKPPQAGGWGG